MQKSKTQIQNENTTRNEEGEKNQLKLTQNIKPVKELVDIKTIIIYL